MQEKVFMIEDRKADAGGQIYILTISPKVLEETECVKPSLLKVSASLSVASFIGWIVSTAYVPPDVTLTICPGLTTSVPTNMIE